jgi:hypothetical protein
VDPNLNNIAKDMHLNHLPRQCEQCEGFGIHEELGCKVCFMVGSFSQSVDHFNGVTFPFIAVVLRNTHKTPIIAIIHLHKGRDMKFLWKRIV